MFKAVSMAFTVATFSVVLASPAHALLTRVWIASTGTDSAGCGPIQTPCRSLQYAHDQTAPSGEIDVKDSAGYGSVIINKAISIVGDGSLAGVLATAPNDAITINAGATDVVTLRGLAIEGGKTNANGIVFNTGGGLWVDGCSVTNFGGSNPKAGIRLLPTTTFNGFFTITNTKIAGNTDSGILMLGGGDQSQQVSNVTIDNVVATNNGFGIAVVGTGQSFLTLSNSVIGGNLNAGVQVRDFLLASLFGLKISANSSGPGIYVYGAATGQTIIGRSTVMGSIGQYAVTVVSPARAFSTTDNVIAGGVSGILQKYTLQ